MPEVVLVAHVLASSLTIGATVSYAVWIALAERDATHLAFAVRAVRRSDRLVAIPAYLVTFATGAWLAVAKGIPFERPWLASSVAIYLAVLVVGFAVFGPVVRRQLAALERGGPTDPGYRGGRGRVWALYAFTIAGLVAMLALMVVRPR